MSHLEFFFSFLPHTQLEPQTNGSECRQICLVLVHIRILAQTQPLLTRISKFDMWLW